MASGKDHDSSIRFTTVPLWILGWAFTGNPNIAWWLAGGYYFGGMWLSPDLDLKSNPWLRWGDFKVIWLPYQKLIPHRNFLSHGMFIGTAVRLLYLGIIFSFLSLICQRFGYGWLPKIINDWGVKHFFPLMVVVVGIELSVWNHLIMDGLFLGWFKKLGRMLISFFDSLGSRGWRY